MRKLISAIMIIVPLWVSAQSAFETYNITQNDMRGTARFMSMAGAFGALGGDMSAISQNPGGIGIYRRSDISATMNIEMQSATTTSGSDCNTLRQSKVSLSNVGFVGAFERNSGVLPFFHFGISYNRPVSYNRHFSGQISDISHSLTNYLAKTTLSQGLNTTNMGHSEINNPYLMSTETWLASMAYNASIINPNDFAVNPENGVEYGHNFKGLMNSKSMGVSTYDIVEEGGVNEFNFHLGGNIANLVMIGASININHMNYNKYTYYGENIDNAVLQKDRSTDQFRSGTASFSLESSLKTSGMGFGYKLGVIAKPTYWFRLGAAIHSPVYWNLSDQLYSSLSYQLTDHSVSYVNSGTEKANKGNIYKIKYKMDSPWRFNFSAAAVLGDNFIISTMVEKVVYDAISHKTASSNDNALYFANITNLTRTYLKNMNIYRLGVEYRIIPAVSVRAGYAYQDSPVDNDVKDNYFSIVAHTTIPSYTMEKSTQYFTCGAGLKIADFYVDAAYVLKSRNCIFSSFSPYNSGPSYESNYKLTPAPSADVKINSSEIVCTIGYRF